MEIFFLRGEEGIEILANKFCLKVIFTPFLI